MTVQPKLIESHIKNTLTKQTFVIYVDVLGKSHNIVDFLNTTFSNEFIVEHEKIANDVDKSTLTLVTLLSSHEEEYMHYVKE